jgi:hypothetical protein
MGTYRYFGDNEYKAYGLYSKKKYAKEHQDEWNKKGYNTRITSMKPSEEGRWKLWVSLEKRKKRRKR